MDEKDNKKQENEQRIREITGKWFLDISKWIFTTGILAKTLNEGEKYSLSLDSTSTIAIIVAIITFMCGLYILLGKKEKFVIISTSVLTICFIALIFIPYFFKISCLAGLMYSICIIIIGCIPSIYKKCSSEGNRY